MYAPAYGNTVVRALTRASQSFYDAPPPGFSAVPLLICSVEAILASDCRIPNEEVAEAVFRSALRRLEEAVDRAEEELGLRP